MVSGSCVTLALMPLNAVTFLDLLVKFYPKVQSMGMGVQKGVQNKSLMWP